jgi:membrane fusion protein (multidrug efflux system)
MTENFPSESNPGTSASGAASHPPVAENKQPGRRSITQYWVGFGIAILIIGATLYFFVPGFYKEETDDAYVEGHTVSVMPKVSAYVSILYFDDNTRVTTGELLVELDPHDYLADSNVARANLDVAGSTLIEARSQVLVANANADEARAAVGLAQANATLAAEDLKRFHAVSDTRAVSSERLDTAQAAADGTQATLDAAKMRAAATASQFEVAQLQVKMDEASVEQARALLARVELNLSYTRIVAPVSGTIANKNVESGNYVQTGQLLFSIVPEDLYVIANYKETQLERMLPGQKAVVQIARARGQHPQRQRFTLCPVSA